MLATLSISASHRHEAWWEKHLSGEYATLKDEASYNNGNGFVELALRSLFSLNWKWIASLHLIVSYLNSL